MGGEREEEENLKVETCGDINLRLTQPLSLSLSLRQSIVHRLVIQRSSLSDKPDRQAEIN